MVDRKNITNLDLELDMDNLDVRPKRKLEYLRPMDRGEAIIIGWIIGLLGAFLFALVATYPDSTPKETPVTTTTLPRIEFGVDISFRG